MGKDDQLGYKTRKCCIEHRSKKSLKACFSGRDNMGN